MKLKIQEISSEISNMARILENLSLATKHNLNTKELIKLLDGYSQLNLEAKETIGPLIQIILNP